MQLDLLTQGDISELNDIKKNMNNLLSIPAGSIPLARGLGISWANLSKINPDLENDYATEIVEKMAKYEPRVSVSQVTFSYNDAGEAVVHIAIEGGRTYGGR
jgi:phage baseplate assembly protein W